MIDIGVLKNKSSLKQFDSGQVIIEDGETMCDEMYILLKGTADIYKNYQEPLEVKIASVNPGDFFGEMSLFLNKERSATVVANDDVIAIMINRMNAYEFFETQPEATYSLIKTLCQRLDSSNAAYKKLYRETHPEENNEEAGFPSLSWLFPKTHKAYRRTINTLKITSLDEKNYKCPICEAEFIASTDTVSCQEPTYNYLRPANGICDFYYEVVMCPNCWYSAFVTVFGKVDKKSSPMFEKQIASHKSEMNEILDDKTGINGIFIKYFLAIKCAPEYFSHYDEMTARLWIRLGWLYSDCKDEDMDKYSASKAQKAYMSAAGKRELQKDQLMMTYFTMGELNFKINELQTAKKFFDIVEDSSGIPELKLQAAKRLEDIVQCKREMVSSLRVKSSSQQ